MISETLEYWKKRIDDQKASGLNIGDWCDKNNLTRHAYYYWRKRIKIASQDETKSKNEVVFTELKHIHKSVNDNLEQLQVSWNDLKFTIINADTAKLAAEFIKQLKKLC